jgi:hypothetical protein
MLDPDSGSECHILKQNSKIFFAFVPVSLSTFLNRWQECSSEKKTQKCEKDHFGGCFLILFFKINRLF